MQTLNYLTVPLLLVICANLIALSVIFAFIYNRSGQSLPVVVLLHGGLGLKNLVVTSMSYGHGLVDAIVAEMALALCLAIILVEVDGPDPTDSRDSEVGGGQPPA
jgi:membrane protease YdiL (CAAX protease family)